ncbi:MAG TPA: hypothetical protein VKV28_14205 [Candidatus Binataceae bacterium]|nr:hypothetical protein [Candidatus Binataceae bacterium]
MARTLVGMMAMGTVALALWSVLSRPADRLLLNSQLAQELEALRRKALCRLVR